MARVVHIQPEAPPKPALGEPCNGCGVCCLWAPCPVGIVASLRRTGACAALDWDPDQSCYRCGVLRTPTRHLLRVPIPALDRWLRRWVRRHIAAGVGCDAPLETERP